MAYNVKKKTMNGIMRMEITGWTNVISTLTSLMTSPEVSTYVEYHSGTASSPRNSCSSIDNPFYE